MDIPFQATGSSNIAGIAMHEGAMYLKFHGSGKTYRYTGPKVQEHYDALVQADKTEGQSMGKHFAAHVRKCPHTKCEAVENLPATAK